MKILLVSQVHQKKSWTDSCGLDFVADNGMPILCSSKYCQTDNSNPESVPITYGSPECERHIFFMERAHFYIQVFHFWNMTKQNPCLPGGECHTPLTDSCESLSVHPRLHTLQLMAVSLSLDIQVGGEPPETVGKLQQPRGKHIMTWKLRFHLNLNPLFLFNSADCIFNSVFFPFFFVSQELQMNCTWMDGLDCTNLEIYTRNFLGQQYYYCNTLPFNEI